MINDTCRNKPTEAENNTTRPSTILHGTKRQVQIIL